MRYEQAETQGVGLGKDNARIARALEEKRLLVN